MENFENEDILTQQIPAEEADLQPMEEPISAQREIPFASTGAPDGYMSRQAEEHLPWNCGASGEKPKKRKKVGKILMRAMAAVLVLALVAAGCGITGIAVYNRMQKENEALRLYINEKLNLMDGRVDKLEGEGEGVGPLEPIEGNLTASQIYEKNIRSIVAINCTATVNNGFGQNFQSKSAGSGFVMSADGYIITNHHVIDGATKITVSFEDGTEYAARLIGSDSSSDIALIKVEATDLQPVTMGSSRKLAVGDQVVAIGNALGELSFSLTVGFISGIDRDVNTDGSVMSMLQTDAAINSGNSGGPLFNAQGEVIGINTAKYSGTTTSGASIEGISFAIPMDDVLGMLEDLRDYGYIRGASMGVYVSDVDASSADRYNLPMGVYVEDVLAGSAAQKAGLQAKDIIIELGGYEIENMNDLTRALRNFVGGQEATVTVWRGGTELVLTIIFDEKTP